MEVYLFTPCVSAYTDAIAINKKKNNRGLSRIERCVIFKWSLYCSGPQFVEH
jgi:hypothetical protein